MPREQLSRAFENPENHPMQRKTEDRIILTCLQVDEGLSPVKIVHSAETDVSDRQECRNGDSYPRPTRLDSLPWKAFRLG